MKGILTVLFILSICTMNGCQSTDIRANYPFLEVKGNTPVTVLFSNDHNIENESSYYEALLDFKQTHPEHLESINVVSSEETSLVSYYDIHTFPTLLIIDDVDVLLRIEGLKDSSEIFLELEASLNLSNEEETF
ncbi:hypothetical protein [Evansella halocellulosilytica]|uniref:hypothetical protein n=1 Tax=Evansella halocellulosilytica TaxID=2011013 RepID=UPI000BB9250E|nr:hypothetical protein [Evansella halocellulosilytica]